jgi:outer membrane receptor protein involved in Fe transport
VVHGAGNYDLGAFPVYRSIITLMWARRGWNAGANVRYASPFNECDPKANCNTPILGANGQLEPYFSREVEANITGDIFGGYELKSRAGITTLTAGVNNIMDTDPSYVSGGLAARSDASLYDYVGRFFYFRLSQTF